MVYQFIRQLRRAWAHFEAIIRHALHELFPKPARSLVILFPVSSLTFKDSNMTAILNPGANAVLSGIDANGLATTQFPALPVWVVADATLFTVTPSADGLSAQIVPTGVAGSTVVTVTSGALTASVDVSFDAIVVVPPTPGEAVSMSIALTQL
jgi:hypothetical protein